MKKVKAALLACAILFGLVPLAGCETAELPAPPQTLPEAFVPEELLPALPSEEPPPEAPELPETPELPEEQPPLPEPEPKKALYVRVLADGLNVRTGAGVSHAVLGQAQRGVLLKLSARADGWYETEYRGVTAFVSADGRYTETAELEAGDERTERIIEAGLSRLGTPYVYGAARLHDGRGHLNDAFSDGAFDCSSLMQYMFYKGGNILLDVTTRTQIKQGERVAEGDLRRGDLLFFTNASRCHKTGIERVGHVALYLGGNYILHTASDVAKIEQISSARWGYFLEARRMF